MSNLAIRAVVALFSCLFLIAAAERSSAVEIVFTNGDANSAWIVDTDSATFTTFATGQVPIMYPLAVTDRIVIGTRDDAGAAEFDLAGNFTGNTFAGGNAFSQLLDGTTNGVDANYGIECCGSPNSVTVGNLDWTGQTVLFDIAYGGSGIAYDSATSTLWTSDFGGTIRNHDLAGAELSSFSTPEVPSTRCCLAYDEASDTLWLAGNSSNVIYNYAKDGTFLGSVTIPGWSPGNMYGAEIVISGSAPPAIDLAITKSAPATAVAGTQITYPISVTNNEVDPNLNLSDDQLSSAIPLPFAFDFLGETKTEVFVSSNGFLSFSGDANGCCSGQPIPSASIPNDFIALYWEDIDPPEGAGAIYYATLGTAPNRIFVVQYDQTEHFPAGNPVTAQVLLYEGSNDIELQYVSAPSDGGNHTVGIENSAGTAGTQIAFGDVSFANEGFLIQQPSTVTAIPGNFIDITGMQPTVDASGVTVTDALPAGTTFVSASGCLNAPSGPVVTCDLGTLPASSTANASITVAIDPSFTGSLDNTATVSAAEDDPDPANNSSTASTVVGAEADMSITKTGPATAIAGTQVTYDITVTNAGPSDAQSVSVADPTPAGYTFASATVPCTGGFPCALGTVVAGGSTSFSVTYDIDPATAGDVTNTATVSSATTDPNGANDSSSATTTVSGEADLGVVKTGPASAVAGGQVTYTITVDNAGPSVASSVSLADPTPAGYTFNSATAPCAGGFPCALGDLAPGASLAVDVTFDVDPSTTGDVTNTATVSSPTTDPNAANDASSATTTIGADADLSIVKTVDDNAVQQGETVTYTLAVSNAGPSDATNVVITDNLPQGQVLVSTSGCFEDPSGAPTCSIGTVAAGSTVAVTLTAQVQRATGLQTNTATVDSDTSDPVSTNNAGSVAVVASFSIPTLGAWGLIALMLTLMIAGGVQVRRMT